MTGIGVSAERKAGMIPFVHVPKIALLAGVSVGRRAGMIHFPKTRQLCDCSVKAATAKRKTEPK